MQNTISYIDLGAIAHNVNFIRSRTAGAKLFAVVKADAYGHGAERVSLHIQDMVDGFCVAITEEGAALRIAGVTKPILVFTPLISREDADAARFYVLTATVNIEESARLCAGIPCHIKVNSGMNRYGCNLGALPGVLREAKECGANVTGVYSHLYCPADEEAREGQYALFLQATELVKAAYPRAICHLSASAGALIGGKFLFDAVRPGIALYGYVPQGFSREGLLPALKVYARRIQTAPFIGGGVGYACADRNYGLLSTYRLGYAEGFFRTSPLGIGNLCMDSFVSEERADLMPVFVDADEYAEKCRTISYEVLCSVTRRTHRIYIV